MKLDLTAHPLGRRHKNLWNSFPGSPRCINNLEHFKSARKLHLFETIQYQEPHTLPLSLIDTDWDKNFGPVTGLLYLIFAFSPLEIYVTDLLHKQKENRARNQEAAQSFI